MTLALVAITVLAPPLLAAGLVGAFLDFLDTFDGR